MESLSSIIVTILEKKAHLTFNLGSRSKVITPNESLYMISHMSAIQNRVSISHNFRDNLRKNFHLTFDLEPISKVIAPNESQYMISYMSTIQMEPLSLIIFGKTADFAFWVIWCSLRSKVKVKMTNLISEE